MKTVCPKCLKAFVDGDNIVMYKDALYCVTCKEDIVNELELKGKLEGIELDHTFLVQLEERVGDDIEVLREEYSIICRGDGAFYVTGFDDIFELRSFINGEVFHYNTNILYILHRGRPVQFTANISLKIHGVAFGRNHKLSEEEISIIFDETT